MVSGTTRAETAGLPEDRREDLVLAVNELASNSVRHGGGKGTVRIRPTAGGIVCEVGDSGRLDDPLAGRVRPQLEQSGGYGLWMANQLCDLVQIRPFSDGTTVRVHLARR